MTDELIEQVARALAPHLEGWREFDQMPRDTLVLRKWFRESMCGINDATQDDALAAARAVIPLIYNKAIEDAAADLATWFPRGTEGHSRFGAIASVRALAKP